jgi:hypothetical protein
MRTLAAPTVTETRQHRPLRLVGGHHPAVSRSASETVRSPAEDLTVLLPPPAAEMKTAQQQMGSRGLEAAASSPFATPRTASLADRQTAPNATAGLSDTRHSVAELPAVVATPKMVLEEHFRVLHHWEGTVLEVSAQGFRARLAELGPENEKNVDEYADFSFESVSDDDRSLAVVGAIFYWFVGYRIENSGQRNTWSTIRFRRLPRWTERELAELDTPSDLDEFFRKDG